ncbi:MOSC domain-containing protein [Zeaxanthinibacter sp. PT1]|uniref:MOSC domain-containing protein n=1 Tax=Zeaxanthinibacter TaxID=561554 RepID=UPI00234AFBF1|nr:MOSC domain-containing protein [Zeaxanthinibacter sp. PT1]MDC6351885.1 MOSC domain-containing protein [Zeaxanthinibacter sp. PT1]
MKVLATNIAEPATFFWEGKEHKTGIYKIPTKDPIYLDTEAVSGDTIGSPKVHGGAYKACYLFSAEEYAFWKPLYPLLNWNWGMFGENLTVSGMKESEIRIGDQYRVGDSLVEVTQPREPCFKLGYRFKDQEIINAFINRNRPGTYVRVLEKGLVQAGDTLKLERRSGNLLTVEQCYRLIYDRDKNKKHLQWALSNESLPQRFRTNLGRGQ